MGPLEELPEHLTELQSDLMNSSIVFGNEQFGITNFILYMILVMVLIVTTILVVGKKLQYIPNNKFSNIVEYGYEFVRNDMGKGSVGHGYKRHIPFLATLFFFILVANFIGLIPGAKAATGSISVTWALAIISFVYFNYWGVKAKGG